MRWKAYKHSERKPAASAGPVLHDDGRGKILHLNLRRGSGTSGRCRGRISSSVLRMTSPLRSASYFAEILENQRARCLQPTLQRAQVWSDRTISTILDCKNFVLYPNEAVRPVIKTGDSLQNG
jgi:hypothetical protein